MAKILNALRGKERSLKKGEKKDDRREEDDDEEFCVSLEITFSIGAAGGKEVKEADAAASEGISVPTAANASKAREREKVRSSSQLSLNRFSTKKN
jgi:hypothetical protein